MPRILIVIRTAVTWKSIATTVRRVSRVIVIAVLASVGVYSCGSEVSTHAAKVLKTLP